MFCFLHLISFCHIVIVPYSFLSRILFKDAAFYIKFTIIFSNYLLTSHRRNQKTSAWAKFRTRKCKRKLASWIRNTLGSNLGQLVRYNSTYLQWEFTTVSTVNASGAHAALPHRTPNKQRLTNAPFLERSLNLCIIILQYSEFLNYFSCNKTEESTKSPKTEWHGLLRFVPTGTTFGCVPLNSTQNIKSVCSFRPRPH
jgi:hypothetical protein